MLIQEKLSTQKLYDTDYNLWVLETVKQLENREFNSLDLENLIEEVTDLSRRDKHKLKSLLRNLFEHLLKLAYWQAELARNQSHWKGEIVNFRKQIQDQLEDSPSLKPYLHQIFEKCYQDGREIAATKSQLPLSTFPEKAIANIDQVLDENWFSDVN
jgi:hypothetical protein